VGIPQGHPQRGEAAGLSHSLTKTRTTAKDRGGGKEKNLFLYSLAYLCRLDETFYHQAEEGRRKRGKKKRKKGNVSHKLRLFLLQTGAMLRRYTRGTGEKRENEKKRKKFENLFIRRWKLRRPGHSSKAGGERGKEEKKKKKGLPTLTGFRASGSAQFG